jgi:hypothetical protein
MAGPLACASGSSDAFEGFQPPGSDGCHEFLVVALVLVGVALGEVGDRLVERVAAAEVSGDGDRVAGPGVRPRLPSRRDVIGSGWERLARSRAGDTTSAIAADSRVTERTVRWRCRL